MITVMLVDDHPIIRAGLKAILAPYSDVEIVAEASSGEEALSLAHELTPNVILMDLNLGRGIAGIEAIAQILADSHGGDDSIRPRILVLTSMETEVTIMNAMEAGAIGYLLKGSEPDTLVGAIRAAADGHPYLDPTVTKTLMTRAQRPRGQNLTPREREILQLVAAGHSNKEIAAAAFVEEATVKAHLTRIFVKLNATSRTSAVAAAQSLGLI